MIAFGRQHARNKDHLRGVITLRLIRLLLYGSIRVRGARSQMCTLALEVSLLVGLAYSPSNFS